MSGANVSTMTAAVIICERTPSADEITEYMMEHLSEFDSEGSVAARSELVHEAPDWLDLHDQDQYEAYLRDGAACLLVIYMSEDDEGMDAYLYGDEDDFDDDDDEEGYTL